jgi:hypothetical protein
VFKAVGSVAKHENTGHFINAASDVAGTAISAKAQVKQSKNELQAQQMQMQQMQQMPGQYRRDLVDDNLFQFSRRDFEVINARDLVERDYEERHHGEGHKHRMHQMMTPDAGQAMRRDLGDYYELEGRDDEFWTRRFVFFSRSIYLDEK